MLYLLSHPTTLPRRKRSRLFERRPSPMNCRPLDPILTLDGEVLCFSLHPENPDASRHFCTSARELLSSFLEIVAPDEEVRATDPNCQLTPNGIRIPSCTGGVHCLIRQGAHNPELESFVEADLNNVVSLFDEFNSGTHGHAGRFDLVALKRHKRAESRARIQFVTSIAEG